MAEVNRRTALVGVAGLTGAAALASVATGAPAWAAPIVKKAIGVPQAVASGPTVYFEPIYSPDGYAISVGHFTPIGGGTPTLMLANVDGYAGVISVDGSKSHSLPAGTTVIIVVAHIDQGSTQPAPRLLFVDAPVEGFTGTGFGTDTLVLKLTTALRGGESLTFEPLLAFEPGTYIDPEPYPQYSLTTTLKYDHIHGPATLRDQANSELLESGTITA